MNTKWALQFGLLPSVWYERWIGRRMDKGGKIYEGEDGFFYPPFHVFDKM